MLKYALVCGRIEQYVEGSVKNTVSRYDGKTPMVEWIDSFGHNCVGVPECFVPGTLEELTAIVRKQQEEERALVAEAMKKFSGYSDIQKSIIEFLVTDGYFMDEIDDDLINDTVEGTLRHLEWCGSLLDAFMDYMH